MKDRKAETQGLQRLNRFTKLGLASFALLASYGILATSTNAQPVESSAIGKPARTPSLDVSLPTPSADTFCSARTILADKPRTPLYRQGGASFRLYDFDRDQANVEAKIAVEAGLIPEPQLLTLPLGAVKDLDITIMTAPGVQEKTTDSMTTQGDQNKKTPPMIGVDITVGSNPSFKPATLFGTPLPETPPDGCSIITARLIGGQMSFDIDGDVRLSPAVKTYNR